MRVLFHQNLLMVCIILSVDQDGIHTFCRYLIELALIGIDDRHGSRLRTLCEHGEEHSAGAAADDEHIPRIWNFTSFNTVKRAACQF